MNIKNDMILAEYLEQKENFQKLGEIVSGMLKSEIAARGMLVLAVEYRVKEEKSLAGKLELKGDKYSSLSDITDILGARVITLFEDEVDIVSDIVKNSFDIDWDNSVDKRKSLEVNTFGYLSVHYICSLKKDSGYPEELTDKRFEIQIRSTLQHIWAVVNHDLGYKSEFGVPKKFIRSLSRLAGLMELADEQFVSIRDGVHAYENDIREKIANNTAENVPLDVVSLREYMAHNKHMLDFVKRIAAVSGAEISYIDPSTYLEQLQWLGKSTIGDLQTMLDEDSGLALSLAEKVLEGTDIDILSSNVGLRTICRAELLLKEYSEDKIAEFLALSSENMTRAKRQAKHLIESYKKMKEGN